MDNHIITRNRRSLNTSVCRRTGVAAVALAAFFAAGFSPFATAPVAHADFEDSLGDLFLDNLGAVLDPAGQGGAGASALAASFNAIIEQLSGSVHDQIEAAITDPANAPLLDAINFPSVALFGRDLIGNGIEVGDPIPAFSFLDQSSGPLADTFTGTNEGLLTPELTALNINVGSLNDGGFLLGDNASNTGADGNSSAQELPPITYAGTILDPALDGSFVTAPAIVSCDGPADITIASDLIYDGFLPIGIPGLGFGVTSADATTSSLFCVPGDYSAVLGAFVLFPPGYTPITPSFQDEISGPVDITCS